MAPEERPVAVAAGASIVGLVALVALIGFDLGTSWIIAALVWESATVPWIGFTYNRAQAIRILAADHDRAERAVRTTTAMNAALGQSLSETLSSVPDPWSEGEPRE